MAALALLALADECMGETGISSGGDWVTMPAAVIPPNGGQATYECKAPHFAEGAEMCLRYYVEADYYHQDQIQEWPRAERGTQESNLTLRFWRPPCYRYTSPPGGRSL